MNALGKEIRRLREEQGISLRELAKRLDVSAAFLSDVELGRRYPSDDVLKEIAKRLKTKYKKLKEFDNRAPVEELKQAAENDLEFGHALRAVIEKKVTGAEILEWLREDLEKAQVYLNWLKEQYQ